MGRHSIYPLEDVVQAAGLTFLGKDLVGNELPISVSNFLRKILETILKMCYENRLYEI